MKWDATWRAIWRTAWYVEREFFLNTTYEVRVIVACCFGQKAFSYETLGYKISIVRQLNNKLHILVLEASLNLVLLEFYPYGIAYGDEMFKDDTVVKYTLSFPFPLTKSDKRNSIFVSIFLFNYGLVEE